MNVIQLRGLEVWLDGERVAMITPGLSETTLDRVRAAFDGVEIEVATNRLNQVGFVRAPGDA